MKYLTVHGKRGATLHVFVPLLLAMAVLLPMALLFYINHSDHDPLYGNLRFFPSVTDFSERSEEAARRDEVAPTTRDAKSVTRDRPAARASSLTLTHPPHSWTASQGIVSSTEHRLQRLFLQQLHNLNVKPDHIRKQKCGYGETHPCLRADCNATFPSAEQRLGLMLRDQHPIRTPHKKVIDGLTDQSGPADVVFIMAASANHFKESRKALESLQSMIMPVLRRDSDYTFKLLYYDLGLEADQVQELRMNGNITSIIRVPFERLPQRFADLRTCAWKPLLMQANIHTSKVTLWMDASVRFQNDTILTVIQHALDTGLFLLSSGWPMASHVAAASTDYLHVQPCLLGPFKEVTGGFLAVRNDPVMRSAVLGVWVSCAFSPRCLCPGGLDCYDRLKECGWPRNRYSLCHRFDQAVLGAILVCLFDWRVSGFYGSKFVMFKRKAVDSGSGGAGDGGLGDPGSRGGED